MIDFHNHVLANVDDGPKSLDESIDMLKTAEKQGITDIINTVHFQHPKIDNKNVDYLVATDAIGMGLNLNINHVTFSSLKKFDGRLNRNLNVSEISQIAGRAGRYKNDGTFGLTKGNHNLDPLSIEAIESHNFELLKKIYWRNSNIDFKSISSVLNSLSLNPPNDILIKKKNAIDERSFRFLSKFDGFKNF